MEKEYLREQAWEYFKLHAAQRMTTFNFFIAIASITSTGLAISIKSDVDMLFLRFMLSVLLMMFSFVFWKLDQRNRTLIKISENTLKYFEREALDVKNDNEKECLQIFSYEDKITKGKNSTRDIKFWQHNYSYSDCFNIVFFLFGCTGLISLLSSIL